MKDPFVNRVRDLAALDKWWAGRDTFGLVWGRRRVGKSWLVARFAQDHPAVLHTGGDRPLAQELALFARAVDSAGLAGRRDLVERPFTSWDEALDNLSATAEARGHEVLVVLDEFPDLLRSDSSLETVLRAFGERSGRRSPLRMLLCGSAVRVMQRIQEERSPLYGRFGLVLQLHPFEPHEAALMLPGLDPGERALVWGLLGGVPLYLSWWDQATTLEQNLAELVCQPGARLLNEGRLVLATEADMTALAGPVLSAIAAGRTKFNEVKDAVRTDPTRTLERLVELRLIERVAPVTEDPHNSRRSRYRVADNFLVFWLGVVDRYRAEIDRGLGPTILPVLVQSLDDHMGPRWEEAFRAHLRRLAVEGRLGPEVVAIGPWWRDGADEIDAVVLRGRGRQAVLVGEAKWARRVAAGELEATLSGKAARIPGAAADPGLALCAREEVVGAAPGTLTVTAEDIFAT